MKKNELYYVRPITDIKDMISSSAECFADRNACLRKEKRTEPYIGVKYKQLKDDVWALGQALYDIGLKDGKRIAVIGENRYEYVLSYLASVSGDTMFVPIDRELASEDILNLLNIAKVSAVIYSPKIYEKIKDAKEKSEKIEYLISMDKDDETSDYNVNSLLIKGRESINNGKDDFDKVKINPDEAKIMLFTSGTTALSKGVLLSHKNIVTNLMSMCAMVDIKPEDVFLSILPPHHTYESTCGILAPLYRGSCVAFSDGLKYIPNNLAESKTSVLLGVPAVFELLYKRIWASVRQKGKEKTLKKGLKISNFLRKFGIDVRRKLFKEIHETFGGNLRLFVSGAAAIDPQVAKGFRDLGILFIQGYGITECAPIVTLNRDINFKDNAAGLPLKCMEVKIDNPNDEGVGEIICKGDNVMLGYYENEEETNKVIKDGWFYTGDLGFIDKDGFVIISGRKKNIIIAKNGKNVYPEELETFINKNEIVSESMVYADDTGDDVIIGVQIYPNYAEIEQRYGKDVSEEKIKELMQEIVNEVNQRNPVWKYIRNVVIRKEEFEKTTTKKIKRYSQKNKIN